MTGYDTGHLREYPVEESRLVPTRREGYTIHLPSGSQTTIYETRALAKRILLMIAGKEYGSGSSRLGSEGTRLLVESRNWVLSASIDQTWWEWCSAATPSVVRTWKD
jgi:hypothetical protein